MNLIIVILVFYFVLKRVKAIKRDQQSSNAGKKAVSGSTDAYLESAERKAGSSMTGKSSSERLSQEEIERKKAELRSRLAKSASGGGKFDSAKDSREKNGNTTQAFTETVQPTEELSTMEYLEQKAREDRIEHALEKRREEQRLRQESGGKNPAMRAYYGESIPPRMKLVKCGYCAAENLISEYADQKNYTCYFCREDL